MTGDGGQLAGPRGRSTGSRRRPFNAEAWLRLGVAAALAGDDGDAERAWLTAERLAPRSAAASADLAMAYARGGPLGEARAAASAGARPRTR